MNPLLSVSPNVIEIFNLAYWLFAHGGWAIFIIGLLYGLWHEYLEEIQGQFVGRTEWAFLQILVPKENTVSTLAVESIFSQMHALHRSLTFGEKYVEGKFQLWYSLELVSFGGKVSFIIRTPKRNQHMVESAFYSQYPTAEIHEISDYMGNFDIDVYKDNSPYDFFGTEWKMSQDSVIPIKTYKDFEHPSAEEQVIDPLAGVIETLERVKPHEFMALQILIQPIQNDEWGGRAIRKIKELTGQEMEHEFSFFGLLLKPFEWFASLNKQKIFASSHGGHDDENKPRSNWLNMTESEKERVTLIEKKANKPCYNTKIRLLYLAPKDNYDKGRRFELIGALRHFSPGGGAGTHNTIKTDQRIWTKVDPYFSQNFEGPFLDRITKYRKYWFMRGFKRRSIYIGSPKFLMSVEELATLYHFPITGEGKQVPAQVAAIASKTSRPPADLPVADVAI